MDLFLATFPVLDFLRQLADGVPLDYLPELLAVIICFLLQGINKALEVLGGKGLRINQIQELNRVDSQIEFFLENLLDQLLLADLLCLLKAHFFKQYFEAVEDLHLLLPWNLAVRREWLQDLLDD